MVISAQNSGQPTFGEEAVVLALAHQCFHAVSQIHAKLSKRGLLFLHQCILQDNTKQQVIQHDCERSGVVIGEQALLVSTCAWRGSCPWKTSLNFALPSPQWCVWGWEAEERGDRRATHRKTACAAHLKKKEEYSKS